MKKFTLKTKLGENIAYTNAQDILEAHSIFSQMKHLPIYELLHIFLVELAE